MLFVSPTTIHETLPVKSQKAESKDSQRELVLDYEEENHPCRAKKVKKSRNIFDTAVFRAYDAPKTRARTLSSAPFLVKNCFHLRGNLCGYMILQNATQNVKELSQFELVCKNTYTNLPLNRLYSSQKGLCLVGPA